MIFDEIMARMQRAARNGERLHLDHDHVMALVSSPVYATLASLQAKDMEKAWRKLTPACSSENFGSPGAQTAKSGPSAGTTAPLAPDAENLLVSEVVALTLRQSKLNKRSRRTLPPTAPRKRSRTTLKLASPES